MKWKRFTYPCWSYSDKFYFFLAFRSTTKDESTFEQVCDVAGYDSIHECWTQCPIYICTLIFLALVFIKEVLEIVARGAKSYLLSLENYIQILLLVASWMFKTLSPTNVELALHACAWMLFFVWIDLTMYLARFRNIGTYVFMSVDVVKTIGLCLVAYSPCLFAYSFGFYVLLHSNPNFSGYVRSFFGVLVSFFRFYVSILLA